MRVPGRARRNGRPSDGLAVLIAELDRACEVAIALGLQVAEEFLAGSIIQPPTSTETNAMFETFTLVGAIVAFANGAFTVWDRWARGRPLAWVTAKKVAAAPYEYVRIKNPGHSDLFILGARAYPPIYATARGHSMDEIVDGSARMDVNVLLRPGKKHDLPIIDLRTTIEWPTDAPSRRPGMSCSGTVVRRAASC